MDHTTAATLDDTATSASHTDTVNDSELIDDELLVEEISIDGMCGVY